MALVVYRLTRVFIRVVLWSYFRLGVSGREHLAGDAALIIASDPMSNFSQPARDHLARIPSVVLDPKLSDTARTATVAFTTSTYGINTGGTVYRMDDIPIPLRPAFVSPYKSDLEILKAIETRIRTRQLDESS